MMEVFQCVPNFSAGRDPAIVGAIADAIRRVHGALLIDYSADVDHNRCVMTILGDSASICDAVFAAAQVAVDRIDLREHTGVHPRVGAIDVVPVVPLLSADMTGAIIAAEQIGVRLANELHLPVYLYEQNARPARTRSLPEIRRGGFEALREGELVGGRAPDLGLSRVHPTAGVTIVGARGPLVAYNVNFSAPDAVIARAIARKIRTERDSRPELAGVRALGLFLASKTQAQVSLNLTKPELAFLPGVFTFISDEAARLGVTELESEIIGAIPISSLGGESPETIRWHSYKPSHILDYWLDGPFSTDYNPGP